MNSKKEIKIFTDNSFKGQQDYKYKIPHHLVIKPPGNKLNKPSQPKSQTRPANGTQPSLKRPSNSRSSLKHSQSLTFVPGQNFTTYCGEVAERTNAQLIRDQLEKKVQDLTSTVSFSWDVLQDMVPELLPYYKTTRINLFSIPRGLQKAGTPPRFYNNRNLTTKDSRGWPVSHLPCIFKNCHKKLNHSHSAPISDSERWNKKTTAYSAYSPTGSGSCFSRLSLSSAKSEYEDERFLSQLSPSTVELIARSENEDEWFLSKLSPSTVELIVSRMTHGLQQERLKKKFKISTKTFSERDPISIY